MGRCIRSCLLALVTASLLVAAASLPAIAQSAPHCVPGQAPTFVLGFAALQAQLGGAMGDPVSCEYADPNGTGDVEQDTTAGLAFWRKSTNTPTFTDGATHWALTAPGLVTWSGTTIDPPEPGVGSAGRWLPTPRTKMAGCVRTGALPDSACTPGALNPAVTPETLGLTICLPGFSSRVRPPTAVTTPLKRELMEAYGLTGQPLPDFELDHLISLELGGAPRDPANLWPEPWTGALNARNKDAVENMLHKQVCEGTVSLSEAQRLIATDWPSARP